MIVVAAAKIRSRIAPKCWQSEELSRSILALPTGVF